MIGSVAMMLEMSFGMDGEARNLWQAMESVFSDGYSTPDLARRGDAEHIITTADFGDKVLSKLATLPTP